MNTVYVYFLAGSRVHRDVRRFMCHCIVVLARRPSQLFSVNNGIESAAQMLILMHQIEYYTILCEFKWFVSVLCLL